MKTSGCFKADVEMTCEILRQIVAYDDEAGGLVWRRNFGKKRPKGGPVGICVGKGRGYQCVSLGGRRFLVHRLVWLYVHGEFPSGFIDHVDCDPSNNRLENLREATQSQNLANKRRGRRNTSGHKGVCYVTRIDRWRAYVTKEYKTHCLGYFRTKEEAFAARVAGATKLHGEFARHE